jgi:hypothetical protein
VPGLHNKYPHYFYKKGNLFSTYLSPDAVANAQPSPSPTHEHKPAHRTPPSADLNRFLRSNLTLSQAGTWMKLVELRRRAGTSTSARSWWQVETFVKSLPDSVARKYLWELERRKKHREPLIRTQR